jgi:hypothetical protein
VVIILLIIPLASFLKGFTSNLAFAQSLTNNTIAPSTRPAAPAKAVSKFLTYSNPSYGIKILFPSNWVVSRNGLRDYSEIVGFYSPLENTTDLSPASVTLSATVYSKNVTLDQYNNLVSRTIQLPGVKVINSNSTLLAGRPAQLLLFSVTSGRTGFTLNNMLVYTVKGNIAYTISFSSSAAKFDHYLSIVQRMLKSFEIRNSTAFS